MRRVPRSRRCLAPLAAAIALGLALPVPAPVSARSHRPKDLRNPLPQSRQVLVVAANLEEAWIPSDNANRSDLAAFARRVSALAPHAPDVLLLQEVTRAGSLRLAKLLQRKTEGRYAIAVTAGRSPIRVLQDRVLTRETSILINTRTMRRVGKGRYFDTTYRRGHGAPGTFREVKRNAAALLRERSSGLRFPVASVHFHTRSQLRSKRLSRRYRLLWSRRMVNAVKQRWPNSSSNMILGGDFNASRRAWMDGDKRVQQWWRTMDRRNFTDSIHATGPVGGVDYIFTRTRVAAAGVDRDYRPGKERGTKDYYSDHRLRWALLGTWRPRPTGVATGSTAVRLSWRRLPGARWIRIERRRVGATAWRREALVDGARIGWSDRRLSPHTKYRYRLVAHNGAEMSLPSRTVRVRTRRDKLGPKTPPTPRLKLKATPVGVALRWRAVHDRGGSGVEGFEVWRERLNKDDLRIGRTEKTWYVDDAFTDHPDARYFVVAYDEVGNKSRRSPGASPLPRVPRKL